MSSANIIEIDKLSFKYDGDTHFRFTIDALNIAQNSRLFIEGPSGCGKTTFLNLLTGLIPAKTGQIKILGTDIATLSLSKRDRFRADHFGIIFQLFNLIDYLTVVENIVLPCRFSKLRSKKALQDAPSLEEAAKHLCTELELDAHLLDKPIQALSIGQQQRVAIARALIGSPEIIVADEPTSALDNRRKEQFINRLFSQCEKRNTTLIFVSHDTTLKDHFNEKLSLEELTRRTD